jgi:hypothetical protein
MNTKCTPMCARPYRTCASRPCRYLLRCEYCGKMVSSAVGGRWIHFATGLLLVLEGQVAWSSPATHGRSSISFLLFIYCE